MWRFPFWLSLGSSGSAVSSPSLPRELVSEGNLIRIDKLWLVKPTDNLIGSNMWQKWNPITFDPVFLLEVMHTPDTIFLIHIYINWGRENTLKPISLFQSFLQKSLLFYYFWFQFQKTGENGLILVWFSSCKTSLFTAIKWERGISVPLPTYSVLVAFLLLQMLVCHANSSQLISVPHP